MLSMMCSMNSKSVSYGIRWLSFISLILTVMSAARADEYHPLLPSSDLNTSISMELNIENSLINQPDVREILHRPSDPDQVYSQGKRIDEHYCNEHAYASFVSNRHNWHMWERPSRTIYLDVCQKLARKLYFKSIELQERKILHIHSIRSTPDEALISNKFKR